VATPTCSVCGRPTSAHQRHVRFGLPDPVLALAKREQAEGTWDEPSDGARLGDAPSSKRWCLRPLVATGPSIDGTSVTFKVWIAIDPRNEALRRLTEIWWDDARYRDLRLEGWCTRSGRVGDVSGTGQPQTVCLLRITGWPRAARARLVECLADGDPRRDLLGASVTDQDVVDDRVDSGFKGRGQVFVAVGDGQPGQIVGPEYVVGG
jgi:hypothetical protein